MMANINLGSEAKLTIDGKEFSGKVVSVDIESCYGTVEQTFEFVSYGAPKNHKGGDCMNLFAELRQKAGQEMAKKLDKEVVDALKKPYMTYKKAARVSDEIIAHSNHDYVEYTKRSLARDLAEKILEEGWVTFQEERGYWDLTTNVIAELTVTDINTQRNLEDEIAKLREDNRRLCVRLEEEQERTDYWRGETIEARQDAEKFRAIKEALND